MLASGHLRGSVLDVAAMAVLTLSLLTPGAAASAVSTGPRLDQPPISPSPSVGAASVPAGRIFARLIMPIACAPPTFTVGSVSAFNGEGAYLGTTITLDFHRATVDCPTPPKDTPIVVPLGVFSRPGRYFLGVRNLDGCCSPDDPNAGFVDGYVFNVAAGTCEGLCLHEGRFKITGQWKTGESSGEGHAVALTSQSGGLWFFGPDNLELVIKVLDGCAVNGHWWVFVTGLTDVGAELQVTDVAGRRQRTYTNPRGHAFAPITDTEAFACSTLPSS